MTRKAVIAELLNSARWFAETDIKTAKMLVNLATKIRKGERK
jgi:hypothetical protein